MSDAPAIIATRLANMFQPDAEMSEAARGAFIFGGASSVDWLRRWMGGLWVGGRVTLTSESLGFGANALNAMAHANDTDHAIRLDRVVDVRDRFGILTRIVDVTLDDGTVFTFRCFGAADFAEKIAAAAAAARRT